MEKIKILYDIIPFIICLSCILNIIGNTIKITFKIQGKYIIWIIMFLSILICFLFGGINFESFLIGIISYSFSISNYDLFKYTKRLFNLY